MNPKTLLIGGEKGGTGKSTICTNLASLLATDGQAVLIIDTDTQESSFDWHEARSETDLPGIDCKRMRGNEVEDVEEYLTRYDHILIDAGGRDSKELRHGMLVSDMLITPVRASQYDVSSLGHLDSILDELKEYKELPTFAIINSIKGNPNMPEFMEAVQAIRYYENIEPLPFAIKDRIAFARSASEGRGVHEMSNPDQKAITEIQTLYNHIYGKN